MECSRGERLAITLAKDNINRSSNRSTTGKLEVDIFELLRDSEYEMGETSKWLKQAMPTNCQGKTEFLYVFYTIYMCVCVRVKEEKRVSKKSASSPVSISFLNKYACHFKPHRRLLSHRLVKCIVNKMKENDRYCAGTPEVFFFTSFLIPVGVKRGFIAARLNFIFLINFELSLEVILIEKKKKLFLIRFFP